MTVAARAGQGLKGRVYKLQRLITALVAHHVNRSRRRLQCPTEQQSARI